MPVEPIESAEELQGEGGVQICGVDVTWRQRNISATFLLFFEEPFL